MFRSLSLLAVSLLVFGFFMVGSAFAGQAGTFTLTPSVGYHVIDGAMDLDDSATFGLGFGYNYNPNWAVEADLRYTPTKTDGASSIDVDIWTISLGALYSLSPESRFDPYLTLGAGMMVYDPETSSSQDEDAFGYYGAGIRYSLTDAADLRLDLRHLLDYRSDNTGSIQDGAKWTHHLQAMMGVSFNFGGAKAAPVKAEPAPAPAPAPVKAEAAPVDSDKDGVLDPQDQCPGTAPGVRVDSVGCPADTDGDGVADFEDACIDTPQGTKVDAHGCPEGVKEVASLTLNILFGVNKADITPFHAAELKRAADFMKKYPMYKVVVEGHTDSLGSDAYNQKLSQRRAESVRNALVKDYGFPADQISATGYGESQPVADNGTEEGRAQNRRVEISIRPN